ncbi:unnamed protein product [Clonostachys rosea]|uniref:GATA-type domain-containing protein n=1 Tax=Bionectria ochroleuca TaxID=29856 RepID=A0ABY6USS0_BIOOC|nr:unnamed protein product [Clonostachys rosea]
MSKKPESPLAGLNASAQAFVPVNNPRKGQQSAKSGRHSSPGLFVSDAGLLSISSSGQDSSSGGPLTPPEGFQFSSENIREPGFGEQVPPAGPQPSPVSDDVDTSNLQPAKTNPKRGPAAGAVAKRFYSNGNGNNVRIDSSVGKRLARLPAQRDPEHRDRTHKPNLKRRGNVEAMLVQVAGEEPARACKSCRKGHGPWTKCVVLEGSLCGSCANCWYNACGSRCTFHDSKAKYETTSYNQSSYHQPPQPPLPPPGPYPAIPSYVQVPGPSASPPVPTYQTPPTPMPQGPPPNPYPVPSHLKSHLLHHFVQWGVSDAVAQGVAQGANRGPVERSITRVQAAAEELGMKIAEHTEIFGDYASHHPPPGPVPMNVPIPGVAPMAPD